MRFLFACGIAILIVATAKTIDVLQSPFGSQQATPLWLPFAIGNFVIYGLGLAMLFFILAAHFALPGAAPRLGNARSILALTAIAAGTLIAAYLPVVLADGLARIVPEERTRFIVFVSIPSLHLLANGLLLIALGVRILRLTRPAAA
jgi:hypothetical protein